MVKRCTDKVNDLRSHLNLSSLVSSFCGLLQLLPAPHHAHHHIHECQLSEDWSCRIQLHTERERGKERMCDHHPHHLTHPNHYINYHLSILHHQSITLHLIPSSILHHHAGWGETPHMIVKCFGCTAIHKALYTLTGHFIRYTCSITW